MGRVIEAADRFVQREVPGRATKETIEEKREEVDGGKLVGINYLIEDCPNGTKEVIKTGLTFYQDGQGSTEEVRLTQAA